MVRVASLSCCHSKRECFQLFPTQYYVGHGPVIDGFYYIKLCPLYANFAESFNHKGMLDFVECFACVYYHVILVFNSIYVVITFIHLHILNHSCIPGMKPTY